MRALILGEETKREVARVLEYANTHPVRLATLLQNAGKPDAVPIGDHPGHQCTIPMGFLVCYSHDEQPTLGMCRHLSVSIMDSNKGPHPEAFKAIAELFGFTGGLTDWLVYIEDTKAGRQAINALQKI